MAAKRWQSCNVLRTDAEGSTVWHFELRKKEFAPKGETQASAGQSLPIGLVGKTWKTMLQPRLDVAWLPPEHVFLHVVQLPQSSFEETISMVELQLEKLSPIPVTQMVWTVHPHGPGDEGMQTVVVVMAERDSVETFLGKLEEEGFQADRLDVSLLDQLLAIAPNRDGAWIFPEVLGVADRALVAWWHGGVLRSIGFVHLSETGDHAAALKDQLMQMAWAGEMDGWLSSPPSWHLVGGGQVFEQWQPVLSEGLGETVEVVEPKTASELAASTAARSGEPFAGTGLLPTEFASRYRQQFVDRLWMRGLGAAMVFYVFGVLIYFAVLGVETWRTNSVEAKVAAIANTYTNALEIKERFEVLNDRQELKYAALDCWRAAAELMPEEITLDGYTFSDGERVTLSGTAPSDAGGELIDFSAAMGKTTVNDQPLFTAGGKGLSSRQISRSDNVSWNFTLLLRRTEIR